jgi:hypothetical protein
MLLSKKIFLLKISPVRWKIASSLIIFLILIPNLLFAQETSNWDNQIYIANKVGWGSDHWKYSGELQVRLKENYTELDNWFLEAVASYLPSENWEFVPDLRLATNSDKTDIRPGLGVLYKQRFKQSALIHQIKWQIDINEAAADNGLRYVLFYNYLFNEKIAATVLGGGFYRWTENFSGIRFMRFGGGPTWIVNSVHSLNVNYFLGLSQADNLAWSYQGIIMVQLIINVNQDFKYRPAKYISF